MRVAHGISAVAILCLVCLFLVGPAYASGSIGQWFWQNPVPQGNWLHDVAFSGDTGWAVGGSGAVVRTLSGGSFWAQQYGVPGAGSIDFNAVEMLDAQHVWLLRADQTVVITSDGGATWIERPLPTGLAMWCLYTVSPQEAWVAGTGSAALHTVDGGATWTSVEIGGLEHRKFVAHGRYLYVLGGDALTRISLAGGSVEQVAQLRLVDLAFWGEDFAIGVTDSNVVWRSEDGGTSWTQCRVPGLFASSWYRCLCLSRQEILILAGNEYCVRSTDGGKSFLPAQPTMFDRYGAKVSQSLWFEAFGRSGGRLFVVGSSGLIAFSKDDGDSWHYVSGDFFADLRSCRFISQSTGYVLSETQLLATGDGGATWHKRALPADDGGYSLARMATDPDGDGWLIGAKDSATAPYWVSLILHSDDGMKTFTEQHAPAVGLGLSSIWTNDGIKAWIGGWSSTGGILRTVDGGSTWVTCSMPQDLEPTPGWGVNVSSLSVSTTGIGYAVTDGGKVLRTTDDGATWQHVFDVPYNVGFVRMMDEDTVWIGARPATIWECAEPGAEWTARTVVSGGDFWITDLAALNESTLLAIYGQEILQSTDGGVTWSRSWRSDSWLMCLATAGGTDAWAAGSGGGVLYNGGLNGDFTPPETRTHAPAGWTDDDSWVTLVPEDQTGIDATWWVYGDDVPTNESAALPLFHGADSLGGVTLHAYKGPIRVTAEGNTHITFYSRDSFGNVEHPKTVQVRIDKHAPRLTSTTVSSSGGRMRTSIVARDRLSGVRGMTWQLDGGPRHKARGRAATFFTSRRGAHRLVFWANDKAGNVSRHFVDTFVVR